MSFYGAFDLIEATAAKHRQLWLGIPFSAKPTTQKAIKGNSERASIVIFRKLLLELWHHDSVRRLSNELLVMRAPIKNMPEVNFYKAALGEFLFPGDF